MVNESPVFVKIDDYEKVLNIIDVIKKKLVKAKSTLNSIKEVKRKEDELITAWERNLTDVSERVKDISNNLFRE